MPRGIYDRNKQATVKKKAVKKANKRASVERTQEQMPDVQRTPTVKEEIIDMLNKRHIQYTDMDGHFAISVSQMVDAAAIEDLIACGIQAINARTGKNGAYIALYY